MNYKGLKIAVIYGQGEEGCGVTRTVAELQLWAEKTGAIITPFIFKNRTYARGGVHGLKNIEYFTYSKKGNDLNEVAKKIDENYDITMWFNYPGVDDPKYVQAFYYEFYEKINKPLKAVYIHDIRIAEIDYLYLVPMVYNADTVFHFSVDSDFSTFLDEMGIQKKRERIQKYDIWMNFEELDTFRQKYLNNKKKGIIAISRAAPSKNTPRTISIIKTLLEREPSWECKILGIEKSSAAYFGFLKPMAEDITYCGDNGDTSGTGPVKIYGPYIRNEGMDAVASVIYSPAFWSLPKTPQNYGDRMEYTQLEIIGVGTIPLLDKHFGENNHLPDGRRFIDVPYSAIYVGEQENYDDVVDFLIKLSDDPIEMNKYLESSYNMIQAFNADKVIPAAIETIKKVGKNSNHLSVYEICKKFGNVTFADKIQNLEKEDKIPYLGVTAFKNMEISYLKDKKKEVIESIDIKKRGVNTKKLF